MLQMPYKKHVLSIKNCLFPISLSPTNWKKIGANFRTVNRDNHEGADATHVLFTGVIFYFLLWVHFEAR